MKFAALTLAILSLSAVTLFASTSNLIDQQDLGSRSSIARPSSEDRPSGYGHQTGIISSVPLLDSRAWVINTPDGRCFDPTNLPDSLKHEGTKINFSYKSTNDWGYIYACGDLIELTQVTRAK